MMVNSFFSVLLELSLVLWLFVKVFSWYVVFVGVVYWLVYVLGLEQFEICLCFMCGGQQFDGLEYGFNEEGVLVIFGVVVWFDCVIYVVYDVGDYSVMIGWVLCVIVVGFGDYLLVFVVGWFGQFMLFEI